jgi:hypothetical protein
MSGAAGCAAGACVGADHRCDAAMNDMLSEAVAYVRPHMERGTVSDKLRTLWAGVAAARDLGAADVVEDEFLTLARNTGLAADLGSHADAGLRHVIHWAMLGQNPFQ